MDPDGLSILIATASTFGALAAAYRAGAVSASEPERQQSGILGFSDRMAGLCAAFVFACGFFVYGFLRIFAQAPWWTLLCLAALAALAVLLYSLGRAKGRIKEKSGFTAACMLGAPLAAPAKLVFKALGLSAQSDVTEEDVLSFVDDVEEHDLIDESQKKMITNIFELDDAVWNYDARRYSNYLLRSGGAADTNWVMAHTAVLHFCGSAKPWKPRYPYRFGVLYQHYQQLERAGRL